MACCERIVIDEKMALWLVVHINRFVFIFLNLDADYGSVNVK